jgi:hypothetical protein
VPATCWSALGPPHDDRDDHDVAGVLLRPRRRHRDVQQSSSLVPVSCVERVITAARAAPTGSPARGRGVSETTDTDMPLSRCEQSGLFWI